MGAMTTIRMAMSGPEEDLNAFLSAHVQAHRRGGSDIDFHTLIPCPIRSWEGMHAAWGCRSHGWDFKVDLRIPSTVAFRFEVKGADAKAEPILHEIARRYPTLTGTVAMVTDTECWSATSAFHDGVLSLTDAPWTRAMFELVEGHPYGEWPPEEEA